MCDGFIDTHMLQRDSSTMIAHPMGAADGFAERLGKSEGATDGFIDNDGTSDRAADGFIDRIIGVTVGDILGHVSRALGQ